MGHSYPLHAGSSGDLDQCMDLFAEIENRLEGLESDELESALNSVWRQAEQALQESNRKYRSLIEHIPDVIWTADEHGRMTYISAKVERLYGFTPQEVYQQGHRFWFGRIHPDDVQGVIDGYRRLFEFGEQFDVEYRIRRRDGEWIWLHDRAIATYECDGARYADGLLSDITRQKTLEEQLLQSQKMDAVGRLAGGVAHDFNNLLTVITGYSDLLLELDEVPDVVRELIQEIKAAGNRAATLTRQLLAFGRRQLISPVELDLNDVVIELEQMLRRLIGEDVELIVRTDPNTGTVKADPGQLEQVVMNLAVNARDAMPGGGRLVIETRRTEFPATPETPPPDVPPGPYVRLSVSDTGCGMDEETRRQVFEPFFTTKAPDRGTGMGLSIVYGIVKQNGGHVAVESAVGQGTTVRIDLPCVATTKPPPRAEGPKEASPQHGAETILLVEDDEPVRSLTQLALEFLGYTVLVAANGTEALSVLDREGRSIDLILSDVVMPQMDGPQFVLQLPAERRHIPVGYMTGHTDDAILNHGISPEDGVVMEKPFTSAQLARFVRDRLERRPIETPAR